MAAVVYTVVQMLFLLLNTDSKIVKNDTIANSNGVIFDGKL